MKEEQAGLSCKSISVGFNNPPPEKDQYWPLGNMVFATEKLLLEKMMRAIGSPPVRIVLPAMWCWIAGSCAPARLTYKKVEIMKTTVIKRLFFALCLFWGMHASANDKLKYSEARGGLLYSTYCSACHTTEIHWRKQKLATGWNSLKAQVRRWQSNIGLAWSEEEITDVAHYLNAAYYGFLVADQNGFSQGKKINQVLRQY